jgi:hypothetical protein
MARFSESLKGPTARTWQAEPPTPHDTRRTVSTRFARAGIPKEIRDRALNHITSLRDPESKHYNLYDFEKEKRAAFNQWAAEIEAIASPARVPLDARKQARQ